LCGGGLLKPFQFPSELGLCLPGLKYHSFIENSYIQIVWIVSLVCLTFCPGLPSSITHKICQFGGTLVEGFMDLLVNPVLGNQSVFGCWPWCIVSLVGLTLCLGLFAACQFGGVQGWFSGLVGLSGLRLSIHIYGFGLVFYFVVLMDFRELQEIRRIL
jgi:hypothetical protein